ncbi:MAG: DUF5711 family protein [Oscillospiraceae bacterium]|jgi:hypothetical protein|nr:DUF5711 family protein [Oscillospiraceae bacterium]
MQQPNNRQNAARLDQKKIMTLLKVLMVIAALLMVLFAMAKIFRDYFQTETNLPALKTNTAVTHVIAADTVLDMRPLGSGVVLLTQTELVFLDSSGELIRKSAHEFASPAIDTKKSNVLLYDKGGTGYKIEKRTGLVFEGQAEKSIITASVTEKGGFALATRADDATSQLIVFSASFKEKFRWNCAAEHIVDVSVSPNNRQAVVAVIGSKDAQLYSKVHVFDFSYAESLAMFDLGAVSVFSSEFTANGTALVYTSAGIQVVSGKTIAAGRAFDGVTARYYAYADNNRSAIVASKFGSSHANDVYGYSNKGKEVFSLSIDENVKALACAASSVSLMLNDRIETYNYSGERIGSVALSGDAVRLAAVSGKLFVLSSVGVLVYKADSFVAQTTQAATTTTQPADVSPETTDPSVQTTAPPAQTEPSSKAQ